MSVLIVDRSAYEITARSWTDQGYLRVPGRVARAGTQDYLARELGLTDRKPDEIVKVYRPPEEVFSPDSLSSYEDVDVTVDHPPELVDAGSYKQHAVGHTTDAARPEDDRYVVVDLIIKDRNAIQGIESGKTALSAGYSAEYHHEPGTTADGEPYEFVQRNIRINHVALVDRARAGAAARLYDHSREGGRSMTTITLDGRTVEVQDNATAQLIQSAFDAQNKSREDMEARLKEIEDEKQKLNEEMDQMKASKDKAEEELEKAQKAASDEALAERIQAVTDARAKAQKVAGADFTCDSLDVTEIKRQALAQARPTVDWADKSEHYVLAAWDMELERSTEDKAAQSHQRFANDLAGAYQTQDGGLKGTAAYNDFLSGKSAGNA